ncbi:MAG: vitamin B12-dependent ribonucleotide reductase [Frankia sp.]|nr:vitamin B12-dependent ribonucleotide reductase [Frankia sp.]
MKNWRDDTVNFEQYGVEFPDFWSLNATNIVTTKYFRGAVGSEQRESSLRQLIDRVVDTYVAAGKEHGYFSSDADAEIFDHELKWALLHQVFSFNSPVWFNVGTSSKQQVSACQPYDALVSTPDGLVPIGELVETNAVGTKVFDATGITQIRATKANGIKDVLRIHLKSGQPLDVTADHLVWRSTSDRTGRFVPAGELKAGDKLEWHRVVSAGETTFTELDIAEAALAGWLQSDGFVGQYAGSNRSLTIEAITVTDAELAWVTAALDTVFPGMHRKERLVATDDESLDCRRTRIYGNALAPFVESWALRTRGLDMTVSERLFTAPLPVVAAYLRSMFQAEGYVATRENGSTRIGLDMISEGLIRGMQTLLARFGIASRVGFKKDAREDRKGCWTLSIGALGDRRRFASEIGFIDTRKAHKLAAGFEMPGNECEDVKRLEIERIETLGSMPVYDIQTDSGEYLSSSLRVHNCFILAVDDTMDSILNWYREEGLIFKGGSGAGLNLSRIRSSKELLSSGGTASGPVSFMRGADASAGTIKSGGATRRAAKMVVLDVDHPDIEEFIETKAREEDKIRALRDAGFDMDLGGKDIHSVQYQNANNSVRVTDEFMRAVEAGAEFGLKARSTGEVIESVDARALYRKMAQAAWECADPGIQYDDTINDWHTCPETGRITASNPCCFTGDTLVVTDDGPVAFEQLCKLVSSGEQVRVATFDTTRAKLATGVVGNVWVAGTTRALIQVTTTTGAVLRCTPEHRFLSGNQWIEARDLVVGTPLVGDSASSSVEVVEHLTLDEPVAVYDLEVQGTHNFVVTSEGHVGAVVHNSEYMHLDNSSCNLASLNLMKFHREDGNFDAKTFAKVVELVITAMDISICFADFPTEAITETTKAYRQLGIGYANLGALLMADGLPYDSDAGRAMAGAITSLMQAAAYKRSAELAAVVGPYEGYARNADPHKRVIRKHVAANDALRPFGADDARILHEATRAWQECIALGEKNGYRNAQASVIAPTGTIGLALDCDTTGLEPDLALVKLKKLVGGASMKIVNQTVPMALRKLGYTEETIEAIVEHIAEQGHVIDAPGLKPEHYAVFDCAMGERSISWQGHIRMMAAIQPFISGALSKTCNLPESATVEDIEDAYTMGWKLGLKALAVYRNNCKVGQPLSDINDMKKAALLGVPVDSAEYRPVRKRLPKIRPSKTVSFAVGGAEGYMTASSYPDDGLGEVFLKMSKQGSTLAGVMDAFSIAISIALQYGVPLETYVSKFINMRFDPAGMTDDPDVRMAQSVMDYIFRRLALDYLPYEQRAELGIFTAEERAATVASSYGGTPAVEESVDVETLAQSVPVETPDVPTPTAPAGGGAGIDVSAQTAADAPLCMNCGIKMRPAGSCYVCESCGSTSGCS